MLLVKPIILLRNFLILLFIPFLFFSAKVWAQTSTCTEKFKAYNVSGVEVNTFCVGETIRFKSCAQNAQPDKEYYDTDKANGLTFPDTIKSVTYVNPGTYTVTQLINTGLPGNNQFERTFKVLATPLPQIQTLVCAQNKINLKITDSNYDVYHIAFGNGVERRVLPGKDTVITYNNPGTYTITIRAAYRTATCTVSNQVTIQTLPEIKAPELLSLEMLNADNQTGSIDLQTANILPEYSYVVESAPVGSSNFSEVQKLNAVPGSGVIRLSDINTLTMYQYRLRVTDACGTATGVYSNTLINLPLTLTTAQNALRLSWPTYSLLNEILNFQIYRGTTLLATLPRTATSYTDAAVTCGRQYCYRVVAQLQNNRYSRSNESCGTNNTTSTPPQGLAFASFNQKNQAVLQLQIPATATFQEVAWQKKVNNGAFSNLASAKQLSIVDSSVFSATNQICYQATYTDSCGQTSMVSTITCPVILTGLFNTAENKVSLNWSGYVGFTDTPRYTLEVIDDATGQILKNVNLGNTRAYTDNNLSTTSQLIGYRIKVTSANSPVISYSNKFVMAQNFSAYIPTAFSPNNDGLNDIFEVKGRFIQAVKLKIYNRWGQVIFESKSPNEGWNGKINGQDAPVGTYIYTLVAQDLNGNTIQRKGSVTLVK
ncbi:gliding motility-associated C-terminal domain-containing protein [Adhaeribacter swui]|uniref:Gliding motility-associated C-terminal domain-containing protein n=1 Tax=Adhaeribacter swui TaxID=2086471 RepID=A0A7G7GCW7_9BACT|nr:gliding motility-associated C-terminal domain-containing protein [Adhaeribacter swui]QNF35001.1 gliding motility-associated C-terminal domain-containing protein [Adhaeribacter swui]